MSKKIDHRIKLPKFKPSLFSIVEEHEDELEDEGAIQVSRKFSEASLTNVSVSSASFLPLPPAAGAAGAGSTSATPGTRSPRFVFAYFRRK